MSFPKSHLFLAGALSLAMVAFVVLKFSEDDTEDRFNTDSVLSAIPDTVVAGADELPSQMADQSAAPMALPLIPEATDPITTAPVQLLTTRSTKVKPGDSLAKIFKRELPSRKLSMMSW